MATGHFFDPLAFLRMAPVITTTASLMYAQDNHLFFTPWCHESYRAKANDLLPAWLGTMIGRAAIPIFTLYPATFLLSIANIYTSDAGPARNLYWAGLACTLLHFAFAKRALGLFSRILEDKSKGNSTADLKAWVDNNVIRSFSVDVPGWLSFLAAALLTLQAKA